MKKQTVAALLCAALTATALVSCAKDKDGEVEPTETYPEISVEDLDKFNYSDGIGDDGFLDGVRALDYVKLGVYKGVEVPAEEHTATADEIKKSVDNLLGNFAETKQVKDRAVVKDDQVNIDYVGSVGGVEFDGGNTKGNGTTVTAGSANYIDDFLTQIIGHKPGETFDVNVTFPASYPQNQDLAGKDAVFVTTINYIEETVVPELTDDFVAKNLSALYGWNTKAEAEAGVEKMVVDAKVSSYVRKAVIENAEAQIPEALFLHQRDAMLSYYAAQAKQQYNLSLEDYVKATGSSGIGEFVANNEKSLNTAAKELMVLQAIAEAEGYKVTEDDAKAYLTTYVSGYTADKYENYVSSLGKGYIMQSALDEMVYEKVEEMAVLK